MFEAVETKVDVLAIGAHPDDIELCCAGTLLRLKSLGYSIGLVDMTRGERGTRGTPELRAAEANAALGSLGFAFRENLDLGDMHIRDTDERRRHVVECIRRHQPRLIFTQYFHDRHPDHEGTAQVVKNAVFLAGAANFDAAGEPHVAKRLLYWPASWVHDVNVFVDVSEFYAGKIAAAQCYRSQFYDPGSSDPETQLSRQSFWADMETRHRNFGLQIGVQYAEAFFMREKIRVDDPVATLAR
ncbi:bacillithiol biosynthesis deacetylase BshB1 [candidate division KSB1 bacterium]|nr:bacillithiol biosynthesis deacetylase BshB1 [candidate division KSB1 bacterium]